MPNIAYFFAKQSAFVFLIGTYAPLPCSVVPPFTALHLDAFLLLLKFVNLQMFLKTHT
jgi:hypothetical protein